MAWLLEEVFKLMSADRITVQYLAREAGEWSHLCIASVKIAERTIRQSKRAEESSSNSTDGAVGRIDAKMVSVS